MSVDVLDLILLHYGDPASYLRQYPWIAAIEFSLGGLRGLGFTVQLDPVPANPCHAQVRGSFSRQQITQLSQAAKWFIEIPGVSITGC